MIVCIITTISFLSTGVTFAVNQSWGICPVLSDYENNLERIGAIPVAQCFRTQAEMLPGPDAFFVSTSLSSSWIPTIEITIGGMGG